MPHNPSQSTMQYNPQMNYNNYMYPRGSHHGYQNQYGSPSVNTYNSFYSNYNGHGTNSSHLQGGYTHNDHSNSNGYHPSSHNNGGRGNSRIKGGSQKPYYKNRYNDHNYNRKPNPSYPSPHQRPQPDFAMNYPAPYGNYHPHLFQQMSHMPLQQYMDGQQMTDESISMHQSMMYNLGPSHLSPGPMGQHLDPLINDSIIPQPPNYMNGFNPPMDDPHLGMYPLSPPDHSSDHDSDEFVQTGGNFSKELPWVSEPKNDFPRRRFIRKHREERKRLQLEKEKEIEREREKEKEKEAQKQEMESSTKLEGVKIEEESATEMPTEKEVEKVNDKAEVKIDSAVPAPISEENTTSLESKESNQSELSPKSDPIELSLIPSPKISPPSPPSAAKSWAEKLKASSPSKPPTSPQKRPAATKLASVTNDSSKQKSQVPNGDALVSNAHMFPSKNSLIKEPIGVVLAEFDYQKVSREYEPNSIARGIGNTGNICFMNSILQVLMHCPPFFKFLEYVECNSMSQIKSETPLMEAMIELSRELTKPSKKISTSRGSATEINNHAISPEAFYSVMRNQPPFKHYKRGRQEDAEEFLGYLLEALHDEFLAAMKSSATLIEAKKKTQEADGAAEEESEWLEVGKNNKGVTVQQNAGFGKTPISQLFAGNLRSTLNVPTKKPSITREPFQQIQLDISDPEVHSIEDALINLAKPEKLQYSTSAQKEVRATKQILIEDTPEILVAHLKRFSYTIDEDGDTKGYQIGNEQVRKISKPIAYPSHLEIPRECVTAAVAALKPPSYTLCGVIYHHGPSATSGHYTADVKIIGDDGKAEWINIDDVTLVKINSPDALSPNKPKPASQLSVSGSVTSMAALLASKGDKGARATNGLSNNSNNSSPSSSAISLSNTATTYSGSSSDSSSSSTKTAYILFYTKDHSTSEA